MFGEPKPFLKRKQAPYPAWELPERGECKDGFHRLSAEDFGISTEKSLKARSFIINDEELKYRIISNDGTPQALVWLSMAKTIFHQELSQMPENYIARLVFNYSHKTVLLIKNGVVTGGIAFRPFLEDNFAEIAFCAVNSRQQIRGFGSHLMARVKSFLQSYNIENILTYADNSAVGYFKRQGFTTEICLNPQQWKMRIKDYEGATLIHCKVYQDIDYLRLNDVIDQQKLRVSALMPDVEVLSVNRWPVTRIKGIPIRGSSHSSLIDQMSIMITSIRTHSKSWPFLKPVSKKEAPNYTEIVETPMDVSTIEQKIALGKYRTMEQFEYDVNLIFTNCYRYNGIDSVYSKAAKELEKFFAGQMADYRAGLRR